MTARLLTGHVLDVLPTLPDGSVRCCVTSPPYWGLRDYGAEGQLGLEPTPDAYVANLVAVFREVRRVLADDGTLWLNFGDSYAGSWGNQGRKEDRGTQRTINAPMLSNVLDGRYPEKGSNTGACPPGLKPKDLVGIPWRVAFALQADGWYLRSDIIWAKPNPMPESVTDRPTKAHEYLFLLSKSARYYYNADAIAEPSTGQDAGNGFDRPHRLSMGARGDPTPWKAPRAPSGVYTGDAYEHPQSAPRGPRSDFGVFPTRNARSVWTIATQPYPAAHFATFPEELPRRCLLAGSAPGDTILDPFSGSGTVAAVAVGNGRQAIGIELNPAYQQLAIQRIGPMLCTLDAKEDAA